LAQVIIDKNNYNAWSIDDYGLGSVRIGYDGNYAKICSLSDGLIVTDNMRVFVNKGVLYTASYLFNNVAPDDYALMRVKVGSNKNLELDFSVETDSKCYVYVYEGSTFSADGTEITAYNHNRTSTNTTDAKVYVNPVVDTYGTNLRVGLIGTSGKFTESSGSMNTGNFRILKKDTEYLIAVQNKDSSNKNIVIRVTYAEVG